MKKLIKILLPIILSVAIVVCLLWYLLVYDRAFARDMLLSMARVSESNGYHSVSTWLYNRAYDHASDSDSVAIELAEQYKRTGNYTKAEYTLSNAIADGGGVELYVALCKTYVQQDKLLDAVNMLNNITNAEIKAQLEAMRPAAPICQPAPGFYSQYISVTVECENGKLYVNSTGEYPSVLADIYSAPISLSDGENTLYAINVGENGLVSPLAIFGYTVGGVVEELKFSDAAMESAVRSSLNVPADKILLTNELWAIKEFTVPEGATSYAELKHMPFLTSLTIENGVASELSYIGALSNLETLTISGVTVSQDNLAAIAKLPNLKKLTLKKCGLSGISVLADATGITHLDLSGNAIKDITAVSKMKSLQEANFQQNAITSVSPLSGITSLTSLDISHNALTTIAPLSGTTALTWLNAANNKISKLGDLGKLKALTYLSLKTNKLTNVSAIASCTALTDLNVAENSVSDISSFAKLKKMMYLDFSSNKVSELPKFSKSCELVSITGSNNAIKSLENLSGLENLNTVTMDNNKDLSSLKPLTDCHKLIEVSVYGTKVKNSSALAEMSVIVNYDPVQ